MNEILELIRQQELREKAEEYVSRILKIPFILPHNISKKEGQEVSKVIFLKTIPLIGKNKNSLRNFIRSLI